jgi:hypothetical protein
MHHYMFRGNLKQGLNMLAKAASYFTGYYEKSEVPQLFNYLPCPLSVNSWH